VVDPEEELGGHDERSRPRHDEGPPDEPPAGKAPVQELRQRERDHEGDADDDGDPDDGVRGHDGKVRLGEEADVVADAGEALMDARHRVAAERGADQLHRRIDDHGDDEDEARTEPEQRAPVADYRPPSAETACCWSWLSTRRGSPLGCTASPMFCWTSSFTLSHTGSVTGASRAAGK